MRDTIMTAEVHNLRRPPKGDPAAQILLDFLKRGGRQDE